MIRMPVSSPASVPTTPSISMLSRAEQAAEARPGMVRTTTMFWATSTEMTPSLKMLRRRVSEVEAVFRSDRAYR